MANHYDVPSWASKAPTGHHLDVTKDDKLIQKLMIDDKRCYLFGRNPHLNDFCIDHGSCSRVHAALVYHKHLGISYLVDLGSTHGTFIGTLRIEGHKPTQLPVNSTFHFGASTRYYVLRERPTAATSGVGGGGVGGRNSILEDLPADLLQSGGGGAGDGAALLGLPESQTELDNLTEYNTAHNRRISMLGITDGEQANSAAAAAAKAARAARNPHKRKRHVTFNEEEIIINPEDVDPSIGRFRNLVKTTVLLPAKRQRLMDVGPPATTTSSVYAQQHSEFARPAPVAPLATAASAVSSSYLPHHLYEDLPPADATTNSYRSHPLSGPGSSDLNAKFGIMLPNPAPEVQPRDVETTDETATAATTTTTANDSRSDESGAGDSSSHLDDTIDDDNSDEPRKKKYAKEAWPGRKPLLSTF